MRVTNGSYRKKLFGPNRSFVASEMATWTMMMTIVLWLSALLILHTGSAATTYRIGVITANGGSLQSRFAAHALQAVSDVASGVIKLTPSLPTNVTIQLQMGVSGGMATGAFEVAQQQISQVIHQRNGQLAFITHCHRHNFIDHRQYHLPLSYHYLFHHLYYLQLMWLDVLG